MTQKQLSVFDRYNSMDFLKVTELAHEIRITMWKEEEQFDMFVNKDTFFKFIDKMQKFKGDQDGKK